MKLSHLSLLFTTFAGTNGLLCQCTGGLTGKSGKTTAACSTMDNTRMQRSGGSWYCAVPDKQTMKQACKQVGMKGEPKCIAGGDGEKEPKEDGPSRPPPPSDPYGGGYSRPAPPSDPYGGGYSRPPRDPYGGGIGGYPAYPSYHPPKDRNYGSAAEDEYHDPRDGTWGNSQVDWYFDPPRSSHWHYKRSLGERGIPVTRRRKSSKRVVRRQRKEVLGEHHAS